MGVGWWLERKRFDASERTSAIWATRARTLQAELVQLGVETEFENEDVVISGWKKDVGTASASSPAAELDAEPVRQP
jgi:hypothetical protein